MEETIENDCDLEFCNELKQSRSVVEMIHYIQAVELLIETNLTDDDK